MKDLVAKLKEFIKTPLGKIALIGTIFLVLLFLAAIGFGLFLVVGNISGGTESEPQVPVNIEKSDSGKQATTPEATAPKDEGEESENSEPAGFQVYEYKDPFEPLLKASDTTTTASSGQTTTSTGTSEDEGGETGSSTTDGTSSSEETPSGPQVLEVQDIYTESGTKYSSVKYSSTVYKVKEGDQVDASPYQVLTIGTESVTFLYGDRRVEVKVGESVLK